MFSILGATPKSKYGFFFFNKVLYFRKHDLSFLNKYEHFDVPRKTNIGICSKAIWNNLNSDQVWFLNISTKDRRFCKISILSGVFMFLTVLNFYCLVEQRTFHGEIRFSLFMRLQKMSFVLFFNYISLVQSYFPQILQKMISL